MRPVPQSAYKNSNKITPLAYLEGALGTNPNSGVLNCSPMGIIKLIVLSGSTPDNNTR